MIDFLKLAIDSMVEDEADGPRVILGPLSLRAFGDAIIKALAAGVSVEPVFAELIKEEMRYYHDGHYLDSSDAKYQLLGFAHRATRVAIAAARVQENERCLALMDAIGCDWRDAGDMAKFYATNYLREAIRALLGKEAQS